MKVVLQKDLYQRSKETFEEASVKYGIEYLLTDVLDEENMLRHHKEGAKCFVIGAEVYSSDFYTKINEGSAVIRYGVGYNAVPIDICEKRNIKVAYTPGTLTDSVAEHTFALLLSVTRKVAELHQLMVDGKWHGITGMELKDKTIAIIGFGKIGQAVARIAKSGFGMNVNAVDRYEVEDNQLVDLYSTDFSQAVKNADIVSLHLATMPETMGFINKERIGQMKDGAILINTSRGELVVEGDLYEALETGKISAAGLDVFSKEPYTSSQNSDFRNLKNVVLTPHCGSNTAEASTRMAKMVVENILAYYNSNKMILIPELITIGDTSNVEG